MTKRLSDAQRRSLESLAARGPLPTDARGSGVWSISIVCANALERMGLVEGFADGTPTVWKVRLTDAGRQALS